MVMGDEELTERYFKSLDKCRTCSHVKIVHSGLDKFCLDVALFADGRSKMCSCKEYVPQENLEFLEYRYSKKKGK